MFLYPFKRGLPLSDRVKWTKENPTLLKVGFSIDDTSQNEILLIIDCRLLNWTKNILKTLHVWMNRLKNLSHFVKSIKIFGS